MTDSVEGNRPAAPPLAEDQSMNRRVRSNEAMDSPRSFGIIVPAGLMWCGVSALNQEESEMNATPVLCVVAVDLAKSVFQLAVADAMHQARPIGCY
jgi:hypothetical protein